MKMAELTKYQKSRLCKCIFCGKEITENQDFQFCTTKYKRFNIYVFIHSDCMIKSNELLRQYDSTKDTSCLANMPMLAEVFDDGK